MAVTSSVPLFLLTQYSYVHNADHDHDREDGEDGDGHHHGNTEEDTCNIIQSGNILYIEDDINVNLRSPMVIYAFFFFTRESFI